MEYENVNYNQINDNMIDEMNNVDSDEADEDNQYNQYNQFEQYDQYAQDNDVEEQYFNDNNYTINKENMLLRNKIEELSKIIIQKDQELIKYNKIIQNVSALQNELNIVKQKYHSSLGEINIKNKIIDNLKNNVNNFNINNDNIDQNGNNIPFIIQQIKNIEKDILEENLEDEIENNDIMDTLNSFYQKLNDYKNKNISEIVKLRNQLNINNNNNNSNLAANITIKDQYYLKIIDTIKNLCNNFPKNEEIGKFPFFSLNDDNEKK